MEMNSSHGGQCCGIIHLHGFPTVVPVNPQVHLRSAVKTCIEDNYDCNCDCVEYDRPCESCRDCWNCAIECVLASPQLSDWQGPLEEFGFKKVFEFHNSNSGNRCYVFYYQTGA